MTEQLEATPAGGGRVVRWFRTARDYLASVRGEMAKVSWPTQPELIKATRMVVVLSLIVGVVLGMVDLLLTKILVDGVAALAR